MHALRFNAQKRSILAIRTQQSRFIRLTGFALIALALWFGPVFMVTQARAEEPYQRFLERLRDEQLFDLALTYLADQQDKPDLPPEFKADIQLERGLLLYQAAAVLPSSDPQRPLKLDQAEVALQQFLNSQRQHPRRGEARMKLGELLLARAEEARMRAGGGVKAETVKEDIPEAIKFYGEAHELFESTIGELSGLLEGLKGARIDLSDSSAVAYRQKLQSDIRQSQLLSAKSVEERGRSRAEGSPERTADLETALKMFSDLYLKEQKLVAVRNYALFYRSSIQATLGKFDDAIDGFQRIADEEGYDMLRPLQTEATTELVELLANQQKFQLAIERGDKWLSSARPDERATKELLGLQLELSKQRVAWSNALKAKDPTDRVASRLIRDARTALRSMLREPGAHQEATRELLAQLGVEASEPSTDELPNVTTFAEANAAAQERIERSETDSIGLETLRLELAGAATDPERQQELNEQLRTAQQAIDNDQRQAIELLHSALRLYQPSDSRESLFDTRLRLAFLLLKQQRPWEAMAVAEFLSRSSAGNDQGLRAAAITLGSYSDLLRTANAEAKVELTNQLQPFAEFLVMTWPQSSEASAAAAALVQLSLMDKNFAQAEKFLALVPAGSPETAKLRRDAGLMFYAQYLQEKSGAGEEAESTQQLRQQALNLLQTSVTAARDTAPAGELDPGAIEAASVLARLLLADKQISAAAAVIFDGDSSPISMLEKHSSGLPVRVVMETYRTAIQLKIAMLAEDKISNSPVPGEQAAGEIREYIKRLQAAATDAESSQTLAGIFVSLARDLREQLEATTDDTKRRKMSETLLIVAVEAAKADSFNTQYWAADTIVSIAQELEKSAAGKAQAATAYAEAAKILEAILAKEKSQPGWISPAAFATQIHLRLAQTSRGRGDFKMAIEQLASVLEENNALLDVQIEAARTYQAWGEASNSGFYKVAIEGGRPDPKTRQKLIWGWGKIQQLTANNPNYSEQFYEARYQLAFSRWQYAKGLQDASQRADEIRRAAYDIESTAKLFPDLGGPLMKGKFQALLKKIQASIN
ncbi:MAG: hypothetical protein IT422_12805 [Pirellulaceae bacterium]|nr:hypothetical protein [Pirellulaceae bacterium]